MYNKISEYGQANMAQNSPQTLSFKNLQHEELELYLSYLDRIAPRRPATAGDPASVDLELLARHYRNFLFDGFGTLYTMGKVYQGAAQALEFLRSRGCQIRLLTNAASRPSAHLSQELAGLGIKIPPEEIISSGELLPLLNTRLKLREAFVLDRPETRPLFSAAGIEPSANPERPVVLLAVSCPQEDPRLQQACEILQQPHSLLVVLNPDAYAPKPDGTRIAVAGMQAYHLQQRTGCKVLHCGKPFGLIYDQALLSLIPHKGGVLMVGDTLGTDIAGASVAGIDSALVLHGNTKEEELRDDQYHLRIRPTYLLRSYDVP